MPKLQRRRPSFGMQARAFLKGAAQGAVVMAPIFVSRFLPLQKPPKSVAPMRERAAVQAPAPVRKAPALREAKPILKEVRAAVEKKPVVQRVQAKPFPKATAAMDIRLMPGERHLSAAEIDAELKLRGSPVAGLGKEFIEAGQYYGIRPEIGLAFFRFESTWGTMGRAVENRSIGNIRYTPPRGNIPYTNSRGFRRYPSWRGGIWDFFRLMREGYADNGFASLDSARGRYAPPSENPNDVPRIVNYLNELYGHKK